MYTRLADWLDDRTGFRKLRAALLLEEIPGGARWRYIWGSCLAFVFTIQVVTGLLLMTAYSPNAKDAWSSVYFIQYQMEFGWLIRGLHHFGSQTMVVLLCLHMLQVVIAGVHLPPREINWWLGLGLMSLVLGMSLTGYLLPWDQKGFWATQVATNIPAKNVPVIGGFLQTIVVGGQEYGTATLTRFFALHVGILPAALVVLLVLHLSAFRRHGVTAPADAEGEGLFWPDQAFRDMLACMAIFGIMIGLVVYGGHGKALPHDGADGTERGLWEQMAFAGRDGLGANLDAPADKSTSYEPRPEWYFLFLFQLLKYFEGHLEVIGTVVIPNGVFVLLFLLPLLGIGGWRRIGHVIGVVVVMAIVAGVVSLTLLALADDMLDPTGRLLLRKLAIYGIPAIAVIWLLHLTITGIMAAGPFKRIVSILGAIVLLTLFIGTGFLVYGAMAGKLNADVRAEIEARLADPETEESNKAFEKENHKIKQYHERLIKGGENAGRAIELAGAGIPPEGAAELLRRDPKTRGKALFKEKCAVCHSYTGPDGKDLFNPENQTFKASDLAGWGTEPWIAGLLANPDNPNYFGRTAFKDGIMSQWVAETRDNPSKKDLVDNGFPKITKWLGTHPRTPPKAEDDADLMAGYKAFKSNCQRCHAFADEGGGAANHGPDFTGYGDADWLHFMLTRPYDTARYGRPIRKDRTDYNTMPVFRDNNSVAWPFQELNLKKAREAMLNPPAPGVSPLMKEPEQANEAEKMIIEQHNAAMKKLVDSITVESPLTDVERELIVRWMQGDHRVVFGGAPITGPKNR